MENSKIGISQKRTFLFIVALFLTSLLNSYAQNNNIYWLDDTVFNSGNCLSNQSQFDKLKLLSKPEIDIDSTTIIIEVNFKNTSFKSLKDFNEFDIEYWLLANNAFKTESPLKITIEYTAKSITYELFYTVCLEYIESVPRGEQTTSKKTEFVKIPVYFATDRNHIETNNLNDAFGTKRSSLKYGICDISIPNNHGVGKIETPSIWRFEFSEDPSKHIVIHEIDLLGKDKFFKSLSKSIKKSSKKSTFLFVHGYNTSFSEAAKRTAQISYDLLFEGKSVFYSWPSQSSMFKYTKDEANIEWSRYNIKLFLEDYITKSGAEDIYLVAHSMGNRGLTKAIVELITEKPELGKNIKEIILAAPDIDADVFKNDIAPKMTSKIKKPITLYVSSDDLALKASKTLHGNPRAGDSTDGLVLVKGIETIDASGVDTSFLSHSYFADTNSIISDIFDLIQSGKRALNRERLLLVNLLDQTYWKVKH